ncbi:MAG: type 1 glutamine amidotransferase domain-containing protein, partial [Vibrio sp.]
EHGANISFASINGDGFPLDPNSLSDMDDSAKNFLLSENKRALLGADNVLSLNQALTQHYDAIYLVGGHGVMWDFKGNEVLDSIIYKTYRSGGVIGAVCHGIAGLLTVKNASGELLIKDKKLTGFSDEEEEAIQLTGVVPFSLEKSLKKSKAQYSQTADNFGSYVVIDQRIVTGQNPASATGVAKGMVNVLSEK